MSNKILQQIENSLLLTSKICSCCKKEKDLNEFRKSKSGTFGRMGYCVDCQDAKSNKYYLEGRKKRLEQVKEWNAEHPELVSWYKEKNNTKRRKKKD
jgi:hypothetical protein